MPRGVTAAAVRRMARHKVASAVAGVCCCAVIAAGLVAATTGTAPAARPAQPPAAPFRVGMLGHPGEQVSLAQYAGRPVVLNFFASWCTPCRKETPMLARFYRSEHGKVAVIGLDENDSAAAAQKFARVSGVAYPVGFDPSVQAASAYGVAALPQTFFLNASHHVVKREFGALTAKQVAAEVSRIAGKA